MRPWDLSSRAARLELAFETLQTASAAAAAQWNDPAYQHFQDKYYRPLEPKARRALDAIQRLGELLRKAERECGPED